MPDDAVEPDDISAMMEALWGPRSGGPVDDIVLGIPDDGLWGPGRNSNPAALGRRGAPESTGVTPEDLISGSIAELLGTVEARHTESIALARAELDAFRAHLDVVMGDISDALASAREDAISAADARVAGAETRLLSRLDAIAAGVAGAMEQAAAGPEVLARLAVVEGEAAERETAAVTPADGRVEALTEQLAEATTAVAAITASMSGAMSRLDGLDARVADELARPAPEVVDLVGLRSEVEAEVTARLTRAIEDLRAQSVTPADLDSLRAETGAEVAGAIAASIGGVIARLDALDQRVAEELARPAPEAVDLVGLRSEVEADVVRMIEARGAEIERAVASETEALARAQADLSRQLGDVVERLDHLQAAADHATTREEPDGLAALDARMQAAIADLAAAVEAQRGELQAGLSEVRSVAGTPSDLNAGLLQDLEAHARDTDADVADMHELHDALDIGLGTLRTEIAELRAMIRKMAGDQADIIDRLESSARVTAAAELEKGRGRRGSRRGS
jgi:hypothetical protein